MKARAFAYERPQTLDDAHAAFAAAEGDASYISGGQSLVPALAMRLQAPQMLIDLSAIADMKGMTVEGDVLRLGALTRHVDALRHPLIAQHAPLLAQAAPHVAHPAIRNRGTLGGSVSLADPASEFPAMMLAMGASMEISTPEGRTMVAADDYFQDLYQTALEPGDILVALHIPCARPHHRWAFEEMARRRGDYAMVGAGVMAQMDGDVVESVRIAFFSVAATPMRVAGAEAAITGQRLDADSIKAAQRALDGDLDPPEDANLPAAMRKHLARVLLGRLLNRLEATP